MRHTLLICIAILLGCVSIGVALYLIQVDKSRSIQAQHAIDNAREDAKTELSMRQAECESLSSGVKEKWNNVMGVTYDKDFWKECVVTYTDTKTGKVQTSPLRFMEESK